MQKIQAIQRMQDYEIIPKTLMTVKTASCKGSKLKADTAKATKSKKN